MLLITVFSRLKAHLMISQTHTIEKNLGKRCTQQRDIREVKFKGALAGVSLHKCKLTENLSQNPEVS